MDESISIITPDHVELDFVLAGIGSRLLAFIIDQILLYLGILTIVLLMIFAGAVGMVSGVAQQWSGTVATTIRGVHHFLAELGILCSLRGAQQGPDSRQKVDRDPRGAGQRSSHRLEGGRSAQLRSHCRHHAASGLLCRRIDDSVVETGKAAGRPAGWNHGYS